MTDNETNNTSVEQPDWEKIMKEDKQFCYSVLESDHTVIEKIKLLSSNPRSCDDIVAEMLQYAPYLENFMEERTVFPNDESLEEFIGTNEVRFDALKICWNELKKDDALYQANRRLALDVSTAITFRDLYETDSMISYVPSDCQDRALVDEFCRDALTIVEIAATYFRAIRPLDTAEIGTYVFDQKRYLHNYFDILKEKPSSQTNEPATAPKKTEKDDLPKTEITPKTSPAKKKKKSAIFIANLLCLGVFAILTILAAILKNSTINIILLATGVLELGVGALCFIIARQRERFTCPECGTKREHHREFVSTSNHVKTSNWGRPNYAEGYRMIEYTHHYIDTYTCPNCGAKMTENVSKGGGAYKERNSGHVVDTRQEPREF